jgi:concentrative nucleoside transporter, CNT family
MKKFNYLLVLFLIPPFLLSGQNPQNISELLVTRWKTVAVNDTLGNEVTNVTDDDHLMLGVDPDIFEHQLQAAGIERSGDWLIEDGKLMLVQEPEEVEQPIDSLVYRVTDQTPVLVFYLEGKEITRIEKNELLSRQEINEYEILRITSDSLVMTDGELIFTYMNDASEIATFVQRGEEGFSVLTILRGLLGIVTLILIAWLFSSNRRAVSWKVVVTGLLIQIFIAFGILFIPFVELTFEFIGKIFVVILDFTKVGSTFLFNQLMDVPEAGYIFALQILPTIIFFSALTSVLFYLGIIQKVVWALAWLMTKALRISGAESLSVAGNIFLGQTESPLMIKAYLTKMSNSEMLLVMIGGMATVAGGVMAAYISFLGGDDPVQRLIFAKHLLTASVMAAPGAIVVSKILIPQTETIDMTVEVKQEKIGKNFLDALSNGTTEGLKLAANVGAMLLVFFAFIAMMNFILLKLGGWLDINQAIAGLTGGQYTKLSMEFILGYTFAPIMWAIGVNAQDITLVGQLLGEKLIASEFVGYTSLASMKEAGVFAQQKSVIMATYMLCGFANFASIGIQIGGIGGLAPNKRWFLSKYGMKALLGGTLASLLSATIIGTIIG